MEQIVLFPDIEIKRKRKMSSAKISNPMAIRFIGARKKTKHKTSRLLKSVQPKVIGSPEKITLKVIKFQQHQLIEDVIFTKIQKQFELPLVAYQRDTLYGTDDPEYPYYRVILRSEKGYEYGVVHRKYTDTYLFKSEDMLTRKSAWCMATKHWTWRSFEDADQVVRWLNINCRDDDDECNWKNGRYAGLPENVWCWLYDRGIFK